MPVYPEFAPVSLEMREALYPALNLIPDGISEFTFSNLFLFRRTYGYRVSRVPGKTFVIEGSKAGKSFFYAPCALPERQVLDELMAGHDYLKNLSESQADAHRASLEQWGYSVVEDRDNFDYVYHRTDLAELRAGPTTRSATSSTPSSIPTTTSRSPCKKDNVRDALEVLERWRESKGFEGDYAASREALELFEVLGMRGCVYYVDGSPAGWCLGEPLARGRMFAVHFEKGLESYKGIYQFINQAFAQVLPSYFKSINREQDLGDEGLGQAKMTYRPSGFVNKYRVVKNSAAGYTSANGVATRPPHGRGHAEAPGFRGALASIALEDRNSAATGARRAFRLGLGLPRRSRGPNGLPHPPRGLGLALGQVPRPRRGAFRSGPASRALSRSRFPPWLGKDPDSGLRLGGHRRDRAASPRGARMGGRNRRRDTLSPRHWARSQGLRYARGPLRETSGPWRCRMAGQVPLAGSGVRRSQFRGRRQLAPDHSLLAPGPRRLEGCGSRGRHAHAGDDPRFARLSHQPRREGPARLLRSREAPGKPDFGRAIRRRAFAAGAGLYQRGCPRIFRAGPSREDGRLSRSLLGRGDGLLDPRKRSRRPRVRAGQRRRRLGRRGQGPHPPHSAARRADPAKIVDDVPAFERAAESVVAEDASP